MATPAFAGNAFLQFKREAVWGTDLAATKRMPCTVLDFQVEAQKIRSKSMDGSRVIPGIFAGTVVAKVVVEIEMQYINDGNATDPNGFLMLLDACFGADVFGSEGFASSGAGPYVHTFAMGHALLNSLLLEIGDGSPGAAGTCVQLTGAKVANFEFSIGLGEEGILKLRVTFVGKAMTTGVTPTAALTSQTTFDPVLGSQVIYTDFLGATSVLQGWKVSVDNGLLEEGQLGSVELREPVLARFAKVETELQADFDSYTALNAFLNHTAATGNPTNMRFVKDATAEYSFKILQGKAYLTSHQHQVSGEGIVRQTIKWESIKDANNTGLILDVSCTQPDTQG